MIEEKNYLILKISLYNAKNACVTGVGMRLEEKSNLSLFDI